MARIPYFDPATAKGHLKETLGKLPGLNIFLMMGHSGDLLAKFTGLGNHILGRADLDPVLREIAIVRVGILSKASYEVYQHERICRQIGMSDALIDAISTGPQATDFNDLQRLVMAFTDDVVANVRAGDATFNPLSKHLSHKEMQESFAVIDRCRVPVLVATQGGCIGGGVDLISACDMRYCTADAYFCIQEINITGNIISCQEKATACQTGCCAIPRIERRRA